MKVRAFNVTFTREVEITVYAPERALRVGEAVDALIAERDLLRANLDAANRQLAETAEELYQVRQRLTTGIGLPLDVKDRDGNPVHAAEESIVELVARLGWKEDGEGINGWASYRDAVTGAVRVAHMSWWDAARSRDHASGFGVFEFPARRVHVASGFGRACDEGGEVHRGLDLRACLSYGGRMNRNLPFPVVAVLSRKGREICAATGVSMSTVGRWRRGDDRPLQAHADALCSLAPECDHAAIREWASPVRAATPSVSVTVRLPTALSEGIGGALTAGETRTAFFVSAADAELARRSSVRARRGGR